MLQQIDGRLEEEAGALRRAGTRRTCRRAAPRERPCQAI
jgi:hypothetical protein